MFRSQAFGRREAQGLAQRHAAKARRWYLVRCDSSRRLAPRSETLRQHGLLGKSAWCAVSPNHPELVELGPRLVELVDRGPSMMEVARILADLGPQLRSISHQVPPSSGRFRLAPLEPSGRQAARQNRTYRTNTDNANHRYAARRRALARKQMQRTSDNIQEHAPVDGRPELPASGPTLDSVSSVLVWRLPEHPGGTTMH